MEETEITRSNLEICPNCLEPNENDLANCKYCGMPLHPEAVSIEKSENPAVQETADTPAPSDKTPTESKTGKKGQRSETMSRVLKYMGLYIIYLAIDQLIQVLNTNSDDRTMGIIASLVYMIAGVMLAWPLLKEWYGKLMNKIRGTETEAETEVPQESLSEASPDTSDPLEADEEADKPEELP